MRMTVVFTRIDSVKVPGQSVRPFLVQVYDQ